MNSKKNKLEWFGLVISFALYISGVLNIIRQEASGGRIGQVFYHKTGLTAVFIGLGLLGVSFYLLYTFIKDLKLFIASKQNFIDLKSFYLLLMVFYGLTPINFILLHYLDISVIIKKILFVLYIISVLCIIARLYLFHKNMVTSNSEPERQ